MRDFFIQWFERLVSVIVVLMGVVIVLVALVVLSQQGVLAFLGVLLIGAIYLVLVGGGMFLGLGIYQNTKRTADLLERLAAK
jgi:hypothetical protein